MVARFARSTRWQWPGRALREPSLDQPRTEEPLLRELKLLVDHRDDLVAERRRCQQRLRWHLYQLDPFEGLAVTFGWAAYPQDDSNALSLYRAADERL